MSHEPTLALARVLPRARGARLRVVNPRPLRIADVALFYGERSGGIRTYLDAKVRHLAGDDEVEHHLIVPGPRRRHEDGRHELRSLRVVAANGYRLPLGGRALKATLRDVRPDVVVLHDPFWHPVDVAATAHRIDARVVVAHHGSSALEAAALPGPTRLWEPLLRAWLRHATGPADAIMSNINAWHDCGRHATMPLRLGVHEAFRPRSDGPRRGDHVLYAGRFSREKGVLELLDAAARSTDPWPLRLIGSGPLEDALRERAERLGIAHRVSFRPYVRDPERLARAYAGARCVVVPGVHETFGLVALEAAATGARVVLCSSAPAAAALGPLGHHFDPGDPDGLDAAIAGARLTRADLAEAAALAWRHRWPRIFEQELAAMRELVG